MKNFFALIFIMLPIYLLAKTEFPGRPTYENTSKEYILGQFPVIDTLYKDSNSSIVYQKIIKSDNNLSKEQLFNKARAYISALSKEKDDIIDIDETNCRITFSHELKSIYNDYKSSTGQEIAFGADFKIIIECKDSRCRVSILSKDYIDHSKGSQMFPVFNHNRMVCLEYPFYSSGKKKITKDERLFAECFFNLTDIVADYFTRIEKEINANIILNDDW